MNEVKIRLARSDELKVVQDLNHALFVSDNRHFHDLNVNWPYEEVGEKYFQGMLSGEKGICWVAEVAGEIVGYLAGRIKSDSGIYKGKLAELENMFVKDEYRSQGVGAKLVEALIGWAKERQVTHIFVNAFSPNTRALNFYQKNGFTDQYSTTLRLSP